MEDQWPSGEGRQELDPLEEHKGRRCVSSGQRNGSASDLWRTSICRLGVSLSGLYSPSRLVSLGEVPNPIQSPRWQHSISPHHASSSVPSSGRASICAKTCHHSGKQVSTAFSLQDMRECKGQRLWRRQGWPVTPLTLDTSTVLLTPPLTPDMSTLPGAWPRFPEPLPFTTIGTATITPPELPLDGIPTIRMENVAGRINELLAIPARAVHLTEDVAGREHELLAISSRAGVHLTEDVVGRLHELLTISSRTGVHISEDVAGHAKTA